MTDTKSKKIIVIDDDTINNMACEILIKKLEISDDISSFVKPTDALNYFLSAKPDDLPDLVLLDINMNEMSGWEFLDKLEELDILKSYPTTILMVSSSISRDDIEYARNHHRIADYIAKPITANIFKEIQKKYLLN